MSLNGLPENWEVTRLGEVCKLRNGYAFKSSTYGVNGIPVIRISDINGGIVSCEKSVKVKPDSQFEAFEVFKDDILIAMSGATTGKFGIYRGDEKAYQNQRVGNFTIIDKSRLENQFLYYQIHSLKRKIEKDAYGGAQPNISSIRIEGMPIVLPPIDEQERIVAKIEELFSELDAGVESLKTAQAQLKTYRQAVLKSAFEGKLTNENTRDGELPEGWKWVELDELMESVRNGYSKKPDDRGTFPILRISSVRPGRIDLTDVRYLEKPLQEANSISENDLLFTPWFQTFNATSWLCFSIRLI